MAAVEIYTRIDGLLKYLDSITTLDKLELKAPVKAKPEAKPKAPKQQQNKMPAKAKQPAPKQKKQESKPQKRPVSLSLTPGGGMTAELKAIALRHDFRIAKILECEKHPNADSMWLEKVEMGDNKPRQVISGLVNYVPLNKMIGAVIVAFANLKPANLRKIKSEAMVFCAKDTEQNKVEFMKPPEGAIPGERIWLEGMKSEFENSTPDKSINCKKKKAIWHKLMPHLRTNENLEMTLAGVRFLCSAGPIVCESIPNGPIS